MSIVGPALRDATVVDLFAGSGALGLEALSRGAAVAHFVEYLPRSFATLRENVRALNAGDRVVLHRADALKFVGKLEADAFDIAFADPPYRMGHAQRLADAWAAIPFARVLGIEHERDVSLPGADRREYGDTVVSFLRVP